MAKVVLFEQALCGGKFSELELMDWHCNYWDIRLLRINFGDRKDSVEVHMYGVSSPQQDENGFEVNGTTFLFRPTM